MAFDCTSFSDQNLTHCRLSECKATWCFICFVNTNCRQEKSSEKSAVSGRGGATYRVHYTRTRILNSRTKLYFSNTEKAFFYHFLGSGRSTSPVRGPGVGVWHHVHFSDYLSFICINICFIMHHMIAYAIENNTFGHLTIQILINFLYHCQEANQGPHYWEVYLDILFHSTKYFMIS